MLVVVEALQRCPIMIMVLMVLMVSIKISNALNTSINNNVRE